MRSMLETASLGAAKLVKHGPIDYIMQVGGKVLRVMKMVWVCWQVKVQVQGCSN